MITGKLIICSNLKVIREILKDRKNSILIDKYKEKKNWLKKIKMIPKNYSKYNTIRFNAYKYAKTYNIDWRTKKLLSFNNFS